MSWKLKLLAVLNAVGWIVVVPILVAALLHPFVNFKSWPGGFLLEDDSRHAELARAPEARPQGLPQLPPQISGGGVPADRTTLPTVGGAGATPGATAPRPGARARSRSGGSRPSVSITPRGVVVRTVSRGTPGDGPAVIPTAPSRSTRPPAAPAPAPAPAAKPPTLPGTGRPVPPTRAPERPAPEVPQPPTSGTAATPPAPQPTAPPTQTPAAPAAPAAPPERPQVPRPGGGNGGGGGNRPGNGNGGNGGGNGNGNSNGGNGNGNGGNGGGSGSGHGWGHGHGHDDDGHGHGGGGGGGGGGHGDDDDDDDDDRSASRSPAGTVPGGPPAPQYRLDKTKFVGTRPEDAAAEDDAAATDGE
jgi:hypothetical protein